MRLKSKPNSDEEDLGFIGTVNPASFSYDYSKVSRKLFNLIRFQHGLRRPSFKFQIFLDTYLKANGTRTFELEPKRAP